MWRTGVSFGNGDKRRWLIQRPLERQQRRRQNARRQLFALSTKAHSGSLAAHRLNGGILSFLETPSPRTPDLPSEHERSLWAYTEVWRPS
ncbi:hypothetical protein THAOC_18304 [Thalassiosira oceanica]|uniref:Uncharacterized protein n=1 Tax=Thalassiosira oceanica TaxID=159749 RepID=K0SJT8_THAOC|nr:hypothetical protein THAOC_18304 [Thalassiosira oceanica]|eukprot:EJK61251.1 hypothetical protein THAOC_18304 [Thalassiosira oceanica]